MENKIKNTPNHLGKFSLGLLVTLGISSLFASSLRVQETTDFPSDLIDSFELSEEILDLEELEEDTSMIHITEALERINQQEKIDTQIRAEVESGYYSLENPLIILDPYSQSPLTALICFTTDAPTSVSIHVEGEDSFTEVNHTFSEITTQHVIPIYGLYPDKLNPVTVSMFDESGTFLASQVLEIQTEPLPDFLESLMILPETFEDGYQEGINFLYENGKLAFDKEGSIRWYFGDQTFLMTSDYTYSNGKFILVKGDSYSLGTVIFYELDKLGKITKLLYAPYGNHHEISHKDNGNLLLAGANTVGEAKEDFIYELDITTGNVVNTLDFKDILQRTRPAWGFDSLGLSNRTDWMHLNSIDYDASDETVIVSSNYQSAVIKVDWPSGDIHWILGNHNDWNPRLQQSLLTPIGDAFEWQYNQHAAEILPDYDNNPDTIDILLFDNGTTRYAQNLELQRQIRNHEIVEPEPYSRMVHYRIHEVTMEVEQIWQYGKERGTQLYSNERSDADLLENGNILGMFLHNQPDHSKVSSPTLVEVTKESTLIWEAELFSNSATGQIWEYRAERLPFYFENDGEHDIYTTAENLIPSEIMNVESETQHTTSEREHDNETN